MVGLQKQNAASNRLVRGREEQVFQKSDTVSPAARVPTAPHTPYGESPPAVLPGKAAAWLPASMFSLTKRTAPSIINTWAPPTCWLEAA